MKIRDIQQKTLPIFEDFGVTYAALFGSFARGQATEKSDIDFLVRFGRPIGMLGYMRFINHLELQLQRKVDVVTEKSINKFVKPYIMHDLKTIYEK